MVAIQGVWGKPATEAVCAQPLGSYERQMDSPLVSKETTASQNAIQPSEAHVEILTYKACKVIPLCCFQSASFWYFCYKQHRENQEARRLSQQLIRYLLLSTQWNGTTAETTILVLLECRLGFLVSNTHVFCLPLNLQNRFLLRHLLSLTFSIQPLPLVWFPDYFVFFVWYHTPGWLNSLESSDEQYFHYGVFFPQYSFLALLTL